MSYRLFLDDVRQPHEVGNYMLPVQLRPEYRLHEWVIVRSYPEFCNMLNKRGIPEWVSFDHDLVEGHYHSNMQSGTINYQSDDFNDDRNKTGYHCAQFLLKKMKLAGAKAQKPIICVHSMNPLGVQNIIGLFL